MLQGSIASFSGLDGLDGLHLSEFKKTSMEIVWVPGPQAFKIAGSRGPVTLLGGLVIKRCIPGGRFAPPPNKMGGSLLDGGLSPRLV